MRKITSLLMLLCMFVGTAWAQGVKLEDLSEDKAYLLKNVASSFYMTVVNDNAAGIQIKNFSNEDNQWFYVLKSKTEGCFNIQTKDGKFLSAVGGWDFKTSDKACDFEITAVSGTEGEYTIHRKEGGSGGNKIGPNKGETYDGAPLYSNHTPDNTNCNWVFEEEGVKAIKVTYKYFIDGKFYTSIEKNVPVKSEVDVPVQAFLTVVDYQGTIGEEDSEITVNCTENLPFAVTTDLSNPAWQVVEMHRYDSFRVWDYVGNDVDVKVTEMSSNMEGVSDDSKLWCFTGNLIDGFKIYNKKAGTSVTMNATSGTVKVGTAAEGNDVWKLKKSSATNDPAACFTHDGSSYMNRTAEGSIGYYSQADNGSTCYFFKPSVKVLEAASAFDGMPQGAVGAYKFTEEQKSAFVAAVNAVVADPDDLNKVKTLSAMIAEAKNLEKIPYTDGYYRIYSAQSGLYANKKGLIFNGSTFSWGSVSNDNVDAIVKLTTDNEKVVLQNVNSNLYMQGVAGASNPNKTDNGHITLTELGLAQYQLVFGNGTMHANGHGNGTGSSGNVINYTAGLGSASAWYIIPATELEVVIGEAGYATTYLPFDVTLSENVKAYAVTAVEGEAAKMTEKADIPANTAAILAGEGTHTLTIAEANSDWTGNMLKGSTVNAYVQGSAYVLSNKDKGVGFYAAELNWGAEGAEGNTHFKNNANRAYLPAPAAGVRFLSFDFGTETAIDELKGENGNVKTVIYDLSGRRVQKAQKGLYIVNGVKVIK